MARFTSSQEDVANEGRQMLRALHVDPTQIRGIGLNVSLLPHSFTVGRLCSGASASYSPELWVRVTKLMPVTCLLVLYISKAKACKPKARRQYEWHVLL